MDNADRLFDVCNSGFMWWPFLILEGTLLVVCLLLAYPARGAPKGIRRRDVPMFAGFGTILVVGLALVEVRAQRMACTSLLDGEFSVVEGLVARRRRIGNAIRVELAGEVLDIRVGPASSCYYDGAVSPDPLAVGARVRVSYRTVGSRTSILAIDRLDAAGASSVLLPGAPAHGPADE